VADALPVEASVLQTRPAPFAIAARLRQQRHNPLARLDASHLAAHVYHLAADLVAQDSAWPYPASQDAGHCQKVVVAEATGQHTQQNVPFT
jgi:hypothetical protein